MEVSRKSDLPSSIDVFRFGEFELNTGRATLMKNSVEVPLRRQCFDVLVYLIRHRGVLVTRQELMNAVWSEVVVTESSLPQCICTIRRTLGDDSKMLIRSMPRSGYLFDAPVEYGEVPANPESRAFPPSSAVSLLRYFVAIAVILVLAFFFLTDLASLPEPGVAESDDASATDLLEIDVPEDPEGTNPQAARHHQLGRHFYGRRAPGDVDRAIDQFRSAVAINPVLADAWVGLAGALWLKTLEEGPQPAMIREERIYALEKALELDPNQPEANVRMSFYYWHQGKWEEAGQHLDRAVKFAQKNAWVLSRAAAMAMQQYQYTEAIALQRRVATLEPLSFVAQANLAHYLRFAGRLDEAIEAYFTALDLDRGNEQDTLEGLFRCYLLQSRYDQAEAIAARLSDGPVRDQSFALLNIALERPSARDEVISRLTGRSGSKAALLLAEVYAYAGDTDAAFQWLDRAKDPGVSPEHGQNYQLFTLDTVHSDFLRALTEDNRWESWLAEVRGLESTKPGMFLTISEFSKLMALAN